MNYTKHLIWLAALVLFTACASLETNSYKFIATVASTVDAAMNGWGDYVRSGQATVEERAQVKAAYQTYQSAMSSAEAAVQAYRLTQDKTALERSFAVLDATKNQLIDLIQKYARHP